ncbi:hypothetical protein PF008_g3665 [Phytophthora fragariae]|uniref:F-box domain-containing protein n=1 Tax=Phytophthora fragariae TaxID=53985 RepID=A0A6G0SDJ2_9STRA|nr:hypothetical protein PF008_g3665 [Phytophthora fragariae]
MQLETLPVEVLEVISGFLASFDAFQLSHTSWWWFRLLSDGLLWHERLVHGVIPENQQRLLHTWKRRYMQARSMMFHGLGSDDSDELARASYACVEYPPPTDWGQFRRIEEAKYTGGVIFGLQSEERDSRNWPQYHQQFVMVDSNGSLYCSVLDVKTPVARDLKRDRWSSASRVAALAARTGWHGLRDGDFPHGDFVGWYGFHGLLDEFRFYSGVLPLDEVRHLARGGELSPKRLSGTLKYPGIRGPQSRINVELVACTRPAEGRPVEIVAIEQRKSFPPKPCRPRAVFA